MLELTVNGRLHRLDVEPDMPLLWVLHDFNLRRLHTVQVDGEAICSSGLANERAPR